MCVILSILPYGTFHTVGYERVRRVGLIVPSFSCFQRKLLEFSFGNIKKFLKCEHLEIPISTIESFFAAFSFIPIYTHSVWV